MASLDFRGEWTLHFKAQIINFSTILRSQSSYTSYIQKPVKMNIAGDDEQDGAITGGPFSALCASMRPGEGEREPGEEEVVKKNFFHASTFLSGGDSGVGPKCPAIVQMGRVWVSS